MRFATSAALALAASACAASNPVDDPAVVPPVFGSPAMETWLAAGFYLAWSCEPAPHVSSGLSPHETLRTCVNPIGAKAHAPDWPVDSAWVSELDDPVGAHRGFLVQRRSEPEEGSASWYWYADADGTLSADGWGFEGAPRDACSACHVLAGTGSNSGHGFVF